MNNTNQFSATSIQLKLAVHRKIRATSSKDPVTQHSRWYQDAEMEGVMRMRSKRKSALNLVKHTPEQVPIQHFDSTCCFVRQGLNNNKEFMSPSYVF